MSPEPVLGESKKRLLYLVGWSCFQDAGSFKEWGESCGMPELETVSRAHLVVGEEVEATPDKQVGQWRGRGRLLRRRSQLGLGQALQGRRRVLPAPRDLLGRPLVAQD